MITLVGPTVTRQVQDPLARGHPEREVFFPGHTSYVVRVVRRTSYVVRVRKYFFIDPPLTRPRQPTKNPSKLSFWSGLVFLGI